MYKNGWRDIVAISIINTTSTFYKYLNLFCDHKLLFLFLETKFQKF